MDSIEHRQIVLGHFEDVQSVSYIPHQSRNKSPQADKLNLIEKIRHLSRQKEHLQQKQQTLQTSVSDLRKLLEAAGTENSEYMENVEEEIVELNNKATRMNAALKYSFRDGNHLRNCALFWKQFVQ